MDEHSIHDMAQRRERPYVGLSDNDVIATAKEIYKRLQTREPGTDSKLLRSWGQICTEMGMRGIFDVVTEGSTNTETLGWFELERGDE